MTEKKVKYQIYFIRFCNLFFAFLSLMWLSNYAWVGDRSKLFEYITSLPIVLSWIYVDFCLRGLRKHVLLDNRSVT